MTLEASVLSDDALRCTPEGYEVDLHLAWYRSLPLSCLEDLQLTVRGRAFDRESIRVLRDGQALALDDLADRVDDEWFVQDALTVQLAEPTPEPAGTEVDLEVIMATRVPYIIIGPQKALVKPTRVRRKVVVR